MPGNFGLPMMTILRLFLLLVELLSVELLPIEMQSIPA
jgi:hypothetical protein